MKELIIGQKTEGTAYFCPKCQNPVEVTFQLGIVGAQHPVHCGACGWDGDQAELAQASFKHEFKSDEEIFQALMSDVRNLLAKSSARVYGSVLIKWGFMGQPFKSEELGRYIMEIAKATTRAMIETRRVLAEEAARARIPKG